MNDLYYKTATELAAMIAGREVSSREVVDTFLAQIEKHNSKLNAMVTINADSARQSAALADDTQARGNILGPLHGVPVTFKDVFETAGLRTTAGHRPLANYIPEQDATVVNRLRRAGAIVLGKTNLPELAMDTQCANRLFGVTRNPWNLERTPGGSSGGEAATVAAGMSPLGMGSDIGGSLRIPAHYCGVFGLKPTEGLVPQSGHIPPLPGGLNWIRHLAVSGPLARSVADLRVCLGIIAGPDGRDRSVVPMALDDPPARSLSELRLVVSNDFGGLPLSENSRAALGKLADDLADAGCRVERAAPDAFDFDLLRRTYGEMIGAMMAAGASLLPRAVLRIFGRLMFRDDPITRAATRYLTTGMKGYYALLERRERLVRELESWLKNYDGWLCPVASTPAVAHRKPGKINTPIEVDGEKAPGHLAAIGYTCSFNLTGNPVVALPLESSADGLPIGVQLVGRLYSDMQLLNTAETLTQITGSFRKPPGY